MYCQGDSLIPVVFVEKTCDVKREAPILSNLLHFVGGALKSDRLIPRATRGKRVHEEVCVVFVLFVVVHFGFHRLYSQTASSSAHVLVIY